VAVHIVALTITCARIFGVGCELAAVGAVDGGGKAVEFDIDLAIDVFGLIDDRHAVAGCGGMAGDAGNRIHIGRIYMSAMAAG